MRGQPHFDAVKRVFDVAVSLALLVLLSPVLLLIAAAVRLDSHGPVLFAQQRAGRSGRVFWMLKFRTMVPGAVDKGAGHYVEENDPRITRVGLLLRTLSLDELPQLINVLKGEMSLVGPRPALPFQAEEYDERARRRLAVRPGMTGLAQVQGRNDISWPERIDLDLAYLDRRSIGLEFRILWRTGSTVLSRRGVDGRWIRPDG